MNAPYKKCNPKLKKNKTKHKNPKHTLPNPYQGRTLIILVKFSILYVCKFYTIFVTHIRIFVLKHPTLFAQIMHSPRCRGISWFGHDLMSAVWRKISSFVGYIWSHTFFKSWIRVENYSTAKYDLRMEESRFSHKSPDNLSIDELM